MLARCAVYARVSTKDKGQDVENQLAQLRAYALAQGWKITEFIDHETGKHSDRAQFQAMFAAARRREIDVVLFWSLDRFTREGALPTLQHLNTLSRYGVGFRSFTEQYLDSCGVFKDAIIAILGTIASRSAYGSRSAPLRAWSGPGPRAEWAADRPRCLTERAPTPCATRFHR
jgi:DNA invertase Pin-like site-specific DNA recombinase